jgi:hypothetical protein
MRSWQTQNLGTRSKDCRLAQKLQDREEPKQHMKIGNGDLQKDRQLRDYRQANNLCFKCEAKYDHTHQCPKPTTAELHVVQTEQLLDTLSDEVLQMLELEDIFQAEQLSLSIHALDGTD